MKTYEYQGDVWADTVLPITLYNYAIANVKYYIAPNNDIGITLNDFMCMDDFKGMPPALAAIITNAIVSGAELLTIRIKGTT